MSVPVPLAYKFVATTVMLLEVNHCASRLQLPITIPLREQEVKVMVIHPKIIGFAGRVDTTNFSFSFGKSGRLRYITRLDNGYQAYSTTKVQGDLETTEFLPKLASIPSTINTNEAYRIATNWLASIEVDVQALERAHAPKAEQWLLMGRPPLPIFIVDWGTFRGQSGPVFKMSGPAVKVMIAGDTKDLLYLRQEDDSYSKRPAALIKDIDKLLAIPDSEFLKYSPLERSNLIARFTAVGYAVPASVPPFPVQPESKQRK